MKIYKFYSGSLPSVSSRTMKNSRNALFQLKKKEDADEASFDFVHDNYVKWIFWKSLSVFFANSRRVIYRYFFIVKHSNFKLNDMYKMIRVFFLLCRLNSLFIIKLQFLNNLIVLHHMIVKILYFIYISPFNLLPVPIF